MSNWKNYLRCVHIRDFKAQSHADRYWYNSVKALSISPKLRRHSWLLASLLFALIPAQAENLAPLPQQARAAHIAAELLSRYHYRSQPIDDQLSGRVFDRYLKMLDGEKMYFTQEDIDGLQPLRTRLDDAVQRERMEPVFALFNFYVQRVGERFAYARGVLKRGFDFTADEQFRYARDKAPWAESSAVLDELWRKRVKNDWLRLRLAGKDDAAIAATLDKRYESSLKRIERLKSEDAFQIFMNAWAESLDPHSSYLGPRDSENFDISLKLSLIGIGAILQERDDYTVIRELVAGGPAARSGKLKVGDRIVAVGQGDGPLTEVTGWRLDDTVKLIRGGEDTPVRLEILPADAGPDGGHKQISLVRKKISLDDQAAKKTVVISDNGKRRIGIISLPTFYEDFNARRSGDPNFRSASRDVARLIEALKKEKIEALVIDLRGNGGGSLTEAIELTGLFIDQGPVVQQRDAQGKVSIEKDERPGADWTGPLGVLIDNGSASASEIFAAAIQDYGRGLVMGQPSFGKGTVQTLLDMDRLTQNTGAKFGGLKMTVAQFYRINGGTTQLRGVQPDVRFPLGEDDSKPYGEAALDNPLPWNQLAAASYVQGASPARLGNELKTRMTARLLADKAFQALQADVREFERLRQSEEISLNEAVRRQERLAQEARLAARASDDAAADDDGLLASERSLANDLKREKARKARKDILQTEAARIMADLLLLDSQQITQPKNQQLPRKLADRRGP